MLNKFATKLMQKKKERKKQTNKKRAQTFIRIVSTKQSRRGVDVWGRTNAVRPRYAEIQ